ncbi:regulatory protein, tetR family [Parafrankia irregularis]|uniref:Regulatory protein, tetR family n=1 Tax=Parafrankia irregularis TaxID=795642 RepID=A0A0S4QRH0_9ACTN|nr:MULTISPECIES: TetR/AcrR family transcriptional regulator [Parafrankia]MBE3202736.1 TetR/AcrR family transcriptional regulator [Parafrankia sp. CH37]CUU57924.1 regulatory protein, tetR family [Parafrankia irregularis]
MVIGRTRAQGADTRTRILEAAVQLFVERGYAGTSVRDIAERLGVTKAALYYHFSSKEMILEALISPFESGFAQLVELARRDPPPPPRAILEALTSLLVETGAVLCAFANDPSVLHHRIGKEDIISQYEVIIRALAGPRPTVARIMRARCAVGCVQSGVMGDAMGRARWRNVAASDESEAGESEAGGASAVGSASVGVTAGGSASVAGRPGGGAAHPADSGRYGTAGGGHPGAADRGGTATWITTTRVGSPTGIRSLTGFTGDSGADGTADAVGTAAAAGVGAADDARPAYLAVGADATAAGDCASAAAGTLSPFAPLLSEELQCLIVEAALAALGPDQAVEPLAQ